MDRYSYRYNRNQNQNRKFPYGYELATLTYTNTFILLFSNHSYYTRLTTTKRDSGVYYLRTSNLMPMPHIGHKMI